jgi:HSP20 family molecular chaperone IbpA
MWYEMDRLFEPFERAVPHWPTFFRGKGGSVVLELIVEHSDCITVEAELPGVDKADLAVTMSLLSRGRRSRTRRTRTTTTILPSARALGLPKTVDYAKVEAKFDNGVLKITAPRSRMRLRSIARLDQNRRGCVTAGRQRPDVLGMC